MENLIKFINQLWWSLAVLVFFVVVLGVLSVREARILYYKNNSVDCSFVVRNTSNIEMVEKGLEERTNQPVYAEKINNNTFRVSFKCPPEDTGNTRSWLRNRFAVEVN